MKRGRAILGQQFSPPERGAPATARAGAIHELDLVELGGRYVRLARPGEELWRVASDFFKSRWFPETVLLELDLVDDGDETWLENTVVPAIAARRRGGEAPDPRQLELDLRVARAGAAR